MEKLVMYHVLIDRFADDDKPVTVRDTLGFCGGNLEGVRKHIPYLRELGVNALWLSPFTQTTDYHGYHVTNFFSVDERFGSLYDLRSLIEDCHEANIKVFMDFVANHVSDKHAYFVEAITDQNSIYRKWFVFDEWPRTYQCFLNHSHLPKLNLEHAPCRDHIITAAKYWLDQGIDGFRLDHVLGPSNDFWKMFRNEVKRHNVNALLIGEATSVYWEHRKTYNMNHAKGLCLLAKLGINTIPYAMKNYIGIFDGVLDFEFQRIVKQHIAWKNNSDEIVQHALDKHYAQFPKDFLLVSFLDNHDTSRFLFEAHQDKEKLKRAAAIQFKQPQPEIIYYGTEVGMTHFVPVAGDNGDREARKPMVWDKQDKELLLWYKKIISR